MFNKLISTTVMAIIKPLLSIIWDGILKGISLFKEKERLKERRKTATIKTKKFKDANSKESVKDTFSDLD